jgi:hypothetical protein
VNAVAGIEACGPLLTWNSVTSRAERIATLLETVSYAEEDLADIEDVAALVAAETWWREMKTDLNLAEPVVQSVCDNSVGIALSIRDDLSAVRVALEEICRIAKPGFDLRRESLAVLRKSTAEVAGKFNDLAKLRDQIRAEIAVA